MLLQQCPQTFLAQDMAKALRGASPLPLRKSLSN